MADVNIQTIDRTSPLLEEVMNLGSSKSEHLGFFPDGAFQDYADREQILVATDDSGALSGYLLYRISRNWARIVHLCIAPKHERKGIARALCRFLQDATPYLLGIGLLCRRDFPAAALWPKLGFSYIDDKPGRGNEGKKLEEWRLYNGHPNLFTAVEQPTKLPITIDVNIFIDWEARPPKEHPESAALREPWVLDEIEFHVTPELPIELKENDSEEERKRQILRARAYPELAGDPRTIDLLIDKLKMALGEPANPNDESDLRHLAHAIAKGSPVFVTRDGPLLAKFRRASHAIDIQVFTPGEMIAYLDEFLNTNAYAPSSFSGTKFLHQRITSGQMETIISQFQNASGGETKGRFRDLVERVVSAGPKAGSFIIGEPQGSHAAIYSCQPLVPETLEVPIFRIQRGPTFSTWVWHLLAKLLLTAEQRKMTRLLVSDPSLPSGIEAVLAEMGFLNGCGGWERAIPSGALNRNEAEGELVRLASIHSGCSSYLQKGKQELSNHIALTDSSLISGIEHRYWPIKIIDANIPTLVVPIRRKWAEHLVDSQLTENSFFAADPELALNREGVYYRASKPAGFTAPARILWYVSQDPMQIRACSRLIEVRIGKPKDLFKRYEHLGVFSWENVFEICKEDINTEIMVLHFDDTIPFTRPITWTEVQNILEKAGCPGTFQSPHKISPEAFRDIYLLGTSVRNT